jgi:hypothetical protein
MFNYENFGRMDVLLNNVFRIGKTAIRIFLFELSEFMLIKKYLYIYLYDKTTSYTVNIIRRFIHN